MLERSDVARILLPTYLPEEYSFAGHMHGFTILKHGAYCRSNPKIQSQKFCAIRNHILLFSAFLAKFLITTF